MWGRSICLDSEKLAVVQTINQVLKFYAIWKSRITVFWNVALRHEVSGGVDEAVFVVRFILENEGSTFLRSVGNDLPN